MKGLIAVLTAVATLGAGAVEATVPPDDSLPADPADAFEAWAAAQGTPVASVACSAPDEGPVVCYGISGGTVVVGQAERAADGNLGSFGVVPGLDGATATTVAAALTIPWPAAFQTADSDPCPADDATGSFQAFDFDDESIVVEVPIVCEAGEWRIQVGQPLAEEARLVLLACVDELVALEPGPPCEEAVDRLALEPDPAAFAVRRLLQDMALQIELSRAGGEFSQQVQDQVLALVDMLTAYANLGGDE